MATHQEQIAAKYGGTLRTEDGFTVLDLDGLPMTDANIDALMLDLRPNRDVLAIGEGGARVTFDHPDAMGEAAGAA